MERNSFQLVEDFFSGKKVLFTVDDMKVFFSKNVSVWFSPDTSNFAFTFPGKDNFRAMVFNWQKEKELDIFLFADVLKAESVVKEKSINTFKEFMEVVKKLPNFLERGVYGFSEFMSWENK